MTKLIDKFGRVHDYLRISLTDRCNFKCIYCNPEGTPSRHRQHSDILSFEEITRLIEIFLGLGIRKIRFTGGEPLARKNVLELFKMMSDLKKRYEFETSITTNGTLIEGSIADYKALGLDRINFSLDSLSETTFSAITGKDQLAKVLDTIDRALRAGYTNLKINTVIMNGINDNEILDFCRFAISTNINVRFIEFMPFSNNRWDENRFYPADKIRELIEENYQLIPLGNDSGPARNYQIAGTDAKISFISSMSDHFCSDCNRLRITSEGKLKLCLFSEKDSMADIRAMLRDSTIDDNRIAHYIIEMLGSKEFQHRPAGELAGLTENEMISIGG